MTSEGPSARSALDRALAAADFDFRRVDGSGLELDRPSRRGIKVIAARTKQLPSDALDAILAWRLAQYLLRPHGPASLLRRVVRVAVATRAALSIGPSYACPLP